MNKNTLQPRNIVDFGPGPEDLKKADTKLLSGFTQEATAAIESSEGLKISRRAKRFRKNLRGLTNNANDLTNLQLSSARQTLMEFKRMLEKIKHD
jgi:hypothetical protein